MDFRIADLNFGKVNCVDGGKLTIKAESLRNAYCDTTLNVEVGAFINCGGFHGDTICTITRVLIEEIERRESVIENKIVEVAIVGSINSQQEFTRGVDKLPSISCDAYLLNGEQVNHLLGIRETEEEKKYFKVGKRSMTGAGDAYLNLDKLLGRHTAIVGTTGSGKSSTVATIVQSILQSYPYPRIIFFDIHNEYKNAFSGQWKEKANCISWDSFSLPYWFLDLEEFISIYYPEAGGTQKMYIKEIIESLKKNAVDGVEKDRISVDSPIFFKMEDLIRGIEGRRDTETTASKRDPFDKLLLKFLNIHNDSRYSFLKASMEEEISLSAYFKFLLGLDIGNEKYISVLDLSGLPAEVRTICVGVLTRLCFDYRYWDMDPEHLPVALILEEAHTYIPEENSSKYSLCLERVEKVAKEGRKYGLSLIVVTQRPSSISSTVLSQCGTFITLRLTNDLDQNKIKRLLPDTLGDQADMLSTLRDGEALITGDALSLPGKVQFDLPNPQPKSNDVRFHKSWKEGPPPGYNVEEVSNWWIKGERNRASNGDEDIQ
ncbi:ATP-binding protein [Lysinibacillus sp. NPDC097162]|uniref:ATP-binding protein n=1 Tax=Lysinibacillus sp. NPDC097162 TaxID=3364140 RepID=UPI0037FD73A1